LSAECSGLGIAFLGLFIAWGKLIPLVCFLLIYPLQILRARKEEKVLEQAFGEDYRRYKASTWFRIVSGGMGKEPGLRSSIMQETGKRQTCN
jgi:protein-S-isoprenylcysteine O-methyltransferase Ste14